MATELDSVARQKRMHSIIQCVTTGQPAHEPANFPLRIWPVKVEAGRVWVEA